MSIIKKRLAVFGKLIYPENRSRFSYDTACCIFSVLNSSEGKPLFTQNRHLLLCILCLKELDFLRISRKLVWRFQDARKSL